MSLQYLLSSIIRETFLKEVGKNQSRMPIGASTGAGNEPPEKGLRLKFKTRTDYSKEEGYRFVEVVIYAPMNYVQVWVRKSWNVIPNDDLETGDDGDTYVKNGKDYDKGSDPWEKIADHDSCWTDGVDSVLKGEFGELTTFDGSSNHWYEIVDFSTLEIPKGK